MEGCANDDEIILDKVIAALVAFKRRALIFSYYSAMKGCKVYGDVEMLCFDIQRT